MKNKITFTVLTNNVDSMGDIVLPGAYKTTVIEPIKMLDHFDMTKQIGIVTSLKQEGDRVIATAMVDYDLKGLYPAIGFQAIKSEPNAHGGLNFTEIKLLCVGVSNSPNADPNIKPIE